MPVRVQLLNADDGVSLADGMSAAVTVDTGHRRTLFGHSERSHRTRGCAVCGLERACIRAVAALIFARLFVTADRL